MNQLFDARPLATPIPPITHAQLDTAIAGLRLGVNASDLHGSLTGYLCGCGDADAQHWLFALELDVEPIDQAHFPHALLERLYRECAGWLNNPDIGFEPLLPADDNSLDDRGQALVEWCRGFLGGLGLAGAGHRESLSEDAAEVLRDIGTIAASQFEYADIEEDENALTEVIEFIRVGVLLVHAELRTQPQPSPTLH